MLDGLFRGIFEEQANAAIHLSDFLLCVLSSLLLGATIALIYRIRTKHTASFIIALAILPAIVCVVIMMVNGNIGAGVAVAGAFSLVRFRSAPGTAREICMIFIAMGIGLVCGMGYLGYAALFTIIVMVIYLIYTLIYPLLLRKGNTDRILTITVPEGLSYTDMFEDILFKYTTFHELAKVKTTNMGSLFKLTYNISIRDASQIQDMIDEIRIKNGNLEITLALAPIGEDL